MADQDEFIQQVRDVLNHLYDYPYLENHPLTLRRWPESGITGPNRAQRLHRLLLETIEALHPPTAPAKDTSQARCYHLLVYRYVEEQPLEDIMAEFGYSRRQFFREQKKAIEMLAASLYEKLPQSPAPSTKSNDALEDEVERVLARRRAIDITEIIEGVLEVAHHLAEQAGVVLACNVDTPLPSIYGTRTLLRQVFLNALSNLIKCPGSQQINLKVYAKKQRVVTELMAQVDPSNSSSLDDEDHQSQGPDLEAVRRLVESVDGHWLGLEVQREGYQCRFDFPTDSQKVLLVVEDNESVIRAFRRYLTGYNYQVVGATTGPEALRLAHEVSPAAITLDVMIPDQDGWEILQALKKDPVTEDIPVIICSVLEDPELARSLGATAYLHKPVAQADLLNMLDDLPATLYR
ncbi:response regulator [Chloroflexota bacterium]